MKLIVGLGNPGSEYKYTRHNIGFMIVDSYLGNVKWKEKYNAYYYESLVCGEKVIFVKPLTYMNLSGNSVVEFANFYKISSEDIIVIHDDLDLDVGKLRIKFNSSSGGHNGIKSIIDRLGTKNFIRMKIGIASSKYGDTKSYVLGKFDNDELKLLSDNMNIYFKAIECIIIDGVDQAQSLYN